ncbi:hypothetical protein F2Q69_00029850 [Brassica cretica]|uniref:Uncharacterized protein n=1 Tax=Brassica cretica TaxID=69181 RepID=A0A8S9RZA4_BRACR|nr:hypothetical protein F2Q69_00029850 [Brassica cretica]
MLRSSSGFDVVDLCRRLLPVATRSMTFPGSGLILTNLTGGPRLKPRHQIFMSQGIRRQADENLGLFRG